MDGTACFLRFVSAQVSPCNITTLSYWCKWLRVVYVYGSPVSCAPGLAMALWAVYHSDSFSGAIEACVNLLGDADSTGAVAGQLAGAIYGYSTIDPRLVANMNQWDRGTIAVRGAMLYFGGGQQQGQERGSDTRSEEAQDVAGKQPRRGKDEDES